jgi:hypothetical protein
VIDERVAAAVRRPVRSLRRIQTRGYAQAFHAIAELDDGSTAFVKAGAEARIAIPWALRELGLRSDT